MLHNLFRKAVVCGCRKSGQKCGNERNEKKNISNLCFARSDQCPMLFYKWGFPFFPHDFGSPPPSPSLARFLSLSLSFHLIGLCRNAHLYISCFSTEHNLFFEHIIKHSVSIVCIRYYMIFGHFSSSWSSSSSFYVFTFTGHLFVHISPSGCLWHFSYGYTICVICIQHTYAMNFYRIIRLGCNDTANTHIKRLGERERGKIASIEFHHQINCYNYYYYYCCY